MKGSRTLYGVGIAGLGLQHLLSGRFLPALFPAWPAPIPGLSLGARIVGAVLVVAGIAIILNRKARALSLVLSGLLLALLCFSSIPYELLLDPYNNHVGSWTNVLTNLALAGGALSIAGSYHEDSEAKHKRLNITTLTNKVIPLGRIFFSITVLVFGVTHFLYVQYVAPLVPRWIPFPIFWTYFAGVALIGAGSAIILGRKRREVAFLLGTMLFLWVFLVHLPSAIAHPSPVPGGAISSLLEAVAYSGTAFLIAATSPAKHTRAFAPGDHPQRVHLS
ncbi:DoxX family protein [Hymenobacter sp. BT491]|uniref:DoxX family protein n=1 Tax=Hymenobacter sp. BT491 TaxID=2766779 RepID=UPI001653BEDF|nr:DoxX family protein [Hymenobacter sp. BT491]MBC6992377.1 DoxX family protein [Hymenobacter sp. BT491]